MKSAHRWACAPGSIRSMGTNRRAFLAGLLAAGTAPSLSWADAGAPTHLSAAMTPDGAYVLIGLRHDGSLAFQIPLSARGHAAAAHPSKPEAVAFARRPGTYAIVIDCISGDVLHRLDAPYGHHFYGHGAFSRDGGTLYTTENHIDSGTGQIGVWSRSQGFRRVGQFASGGIGPHEMLRLPGRDVLAVANGGILTRPATGREKLNLSTMAPNLTLLSGTGTLIDQVALPPELHQNSLRHIAADPHGIACAFQWQGDPYDSPSLLAYFTPERGLNLLEAPEHRIRALNGYGGSVAILADQQIALTSPRGGVLQHYNRDQDFVAQSSQVDICGVASGPNSGLATDGLGGVHRIDAKMQTLARHKLAFDNHLIKI